MKKTILLVVWMLLTMPLLASHIVGAEITYSRTGSGQYDVYVKVIRDCNGIQDAGTDLNIYSLDTSFNFNLSPDSLLSSRDITPSNRCNIPSRCQSGSSQFGFEERIWKYTLDLSAYSICEWYIGYQVSSARSNSLTNINLPANYYTYAIVNRCINNSSPVFESLPLLIACHNKDIVYPIGVVDTVDVQDSFSYSLDTALQGRNFYCSYTGTYNPRSPLAYFGYPNSNLSWPAGFGVKEATKSLLFRPTLSGSYNVIVIRVVEWRKNGQGVWEKIGVIRRDMHLAVIPCPNNKDPRLRPPYAREFCEGDTGVLNFVSEDDDANDSTFVRILNTVPGMQTSTTNGLEQFAKGTMTWCPPEGSASNIPYTFYVEVVDNSCNYSGRSVRAYSIFVRDSTIAPADHAGPDFWFRPGDTLVMQGKTLNLGEAWYTSSGDGHFDDSFSRTPMYVPGPNDLEACSIAVYRIPVPGSRCHPAAPDTLYLRQVIDSIEITVQFDSFMTDTISLFLNSPYSGQVNWTSSGTGIFSGGNGMSYVLSQADKDLGQVTLYASQQGPCGAIVDSLRVMYIPASFQEAWAEGLVLYPNPVANELVISWSPESHLSDVRIFSLQGSELRHVAVRGLTEVRINTETLASGMYYLILRNSQGKTLCRKLVRE